MVTDPERIEFNQRMVINRAQTHALSSAAKHPHSPLTAGQDAWLDMCHRSNCLASYKAEGHNPLIGDMSAKAANRVKKRLKTRQVFQGDGSPRRIQVAYRSGCI